MKRGLTLRDVSDEAGVDLSQLSKIERGEAGVSAEVLVELARALKAAPGSLLPAAGSA